MSAPRAKQGFALPAVLAVTAVVTLVFLVAILALRDLGDEARRAVARGRFETLAASLEAHVAYAAATGAAAPQGFVAPAAGRGPGLLVTADGRVQRVAGQPNLALSIQDEAGLINLDSLPPAAMGALFEQLAVPVDRRAAMVDRLSDFLDADDLARTDGAEASAYRDQGLTPPPNGPLRRLDQVLGVLGWKAAAPRAAWRTLRDDLTVDPVATEINVNTATPAALRVLYGFNDAQVAAVGEARRRAPFARLEDVGRAAGVRLSGDAERVYGFPNGRFAVKIASTRSDLAYRARIVLSPEDPERPVWIEAQALSAPAAKLKAEQLTDAPFFPDPAPGLADPGRPLRTR